MYQQPLDDAISEKKYILTLLKAMTAKNISDENILKPGWFSVGICKHKPGYKSHDLL